MEENALVRNGSLLDTRPHGRKLFLEHVLRSAPKLLKHIIALRQATRSYVREFASWQRVLHLSVTDVPSWSKRPETHGLRSF